MTRLIHLRRGAVDPGALRGDLERALDGSAPLALGFDPVPDDMVREGTAVVVATSGSTGTPKKVVLSGSALRASAAATAERVGAGRWLLALPPVYVAGMQVLVRSIMAGTQPVAVAGPFRADVFADAALAMPVDRPLLASLVPAQVERLLEAAAQERRIREALGRFDAILVGGQALPASVWERALAVGARVVRTYGASETSGGCVYDGVPLADVSVAVVDGELRVSGPILADGYLGAPSLTAERLVEDRGRRWYRTGDLGLVDDGLVRVIGRADNVIVSGGINVSLDRVELVVRAVPGLERATVIGMPDPRWGESSWVVVAGEPGGDALATARARVAAEIGSPARPVRLVVVPFVPTLPTGKPDRHRLRELIARLPS